MSYTESHMSPSVSGGPPPAGGRRRLAVAVLVALACGGAVVAYFGVNARSRALAVSRSESGQFAVPAVAVVKPKRGAANEELALPADIQPYVSSPIYARTNGYLKRWYVDIGAHVKAGQLMAEIDAPEVEQQLRQAKADVATAKANHELARSTAVRYRDLLKENAVAVQEAETASGEAKAKEAILAAAEANLKRLRELQGFQRIEAPFDGVVTARNVDVGALVDSGGGSGSRRELFHLAAPGRLRVYVGVPQSHAPTIKPGLEGTLELPEYPGRRFKAKVARTAESIDGDSRTLRVEFELDNPSGEVLTGAFGTMHIGLATPATTLTLPSNTLMFTPQGLFVATVQNGKVSLVPVKLGRDFGKEVEVVTGLKGGETVVMNPPDSLVSGDAVRIVPTVEKKPEEKKPDEKKPAGAKPDDKKADYRTPAAPGTLAVAS
jgi:RND family efflux transporter MFP subunit